MKLPRVLVQLVLPCLEGQVRPITWRRRGRRWVREEHGAEEARGLPSRRERRK